MLEANLIDRDQLDALLVYQKIAPQRMLLGRLSVEMGFVKDDVFAPFLAYYFEVPYLDLDGYWMIQKEAVKIVPEYIARRLNVLPIVKENDTLTVAVSDPLDLIAFENLETVTRCHVKPVVSTSAKIKEGIEVTYKNKLRK